MDINLFRSTTQWGEIIDEMYDPDVPGPSHQAPHNQASQNRPQIPQENQQGGVRQGVRQRRGRLCHTETRLG